MPDNPLANPAGDDGAAPALQPFARWRLPGQRPIACARVLHARSAHTVSHMLAVICPAANGLSVALRRYGRTCVALRGPKRKTVCQDDSAVSNLGAICRRRLPYVRTVCASRARTIWK